MNVSYSFLNELIALPQISELIDRFTETGTEVEGVTALGESFDNIVTAQVVSKEPHPDSDHMWVTLVDVGEEEPLQIVCGAQNFNQGDHIVTAKIGAVLPGDFKIKKSKLRGVVSCGMNCSARELGLGDDHEGIMILPEDAPIGVPFAQYAGLSEEIMELEITPNRPDCLSVYGIAREVGAMFNKPYYLEMKTPHECDENASDKVQVAVQSYERCPHYSVRVIKNIKVGPSPEWLAKRVQSCGTRSINNVVDVTNYIMFLLGQPLHAFDYDYLTNISPAPISQNAPINVSVRGAYEGEQFTTLDGVDRVLSPDMTVIAVDDKPVALAGVMGGQNSEVNEKTCTVMLESALFSSAHTSRTSRNLSLFSESSMRYERGVDPEMCEAALDYAAALLEEVAGGEVLSGIVVDAGPRKEPSSVQLRAHRLRAFVGAEISNEEIETSLTALGCTLKRVNQEEDAIYEVVVPSFRPDLEREVDLFEEVLRLWGMERVPSTIPAARGHWGGYDAQQKLENKMGSILRSVGLNETITYSLVPALDLEHLNMPDRGKGLAVELINPMSEDQSVLRRTLIPGLLRSVDYNIKHGVQDVALYEIGTIFIGAEGKKQPQERDLISAVMCGSLTQAAWNSHRVTLGFFDAKGVLEELLDQLNVPKVRFKVADPELYPHLQPGRAAEVYSGGSLLGWIGEIHPRSLGAFDIKETVAAFEIDKTALLKAAQGWTGYTEVPRFPGVEVDCSLTCDEEVTCERVQQAFSSAGGKLLSSATLFDVYRDEDRLGAGKKSLAFKLVYRALDRTLTSEEADKLHEKVLTKVMKATGAAQRA